MPRKRKLKVNLGTAERQEACLETLQMCVHITRDLIGDATRMDGPIALAALAAVFDQLVADVILSMDDSPFP